MLSGGLRRALAQPIPDTTLETIELHEEEHQPRQQQHAKRRRLNAAREYGRDRLPDELGRVRRAEVFEEDRLVETVYESAKPFEKLAGLALIDGEIRPVEASAACQRPIDGVRRALARGESQEDPGRKNRIEKRRRVADQNVTVAGHLRRGSRVVGNRKDLGDAAAAIQDPAHSGRSRDKSVPPGFQGGAAGLFRQRRL